MSYFSDKTGEVTLTVVQTLHIAPKGLETLSEFLIVPVNSTVGLSTLRVNECFSNLIRCMLTFFKSHSVHADVFQISFGAC